MSYFPETTFFEVTRHSAVVELRLNRQDKANAMNRAFWDELPCIAEALNLDPSVRAVVITGQGKHFSSGIDLATFTEIAQLMQNEQGRAALALRDLIKRLQSAFTALEDLRVPVIAAVHGACIGGAVDFITACDIRLAARDTRFAIEEINIGMTADVGTLQRLPKLIPMGIVMELAMSGRAFDAQEAKSWGLVNAIHENAEDTRTAALALAHELSAKSPLAMAGVKRAVLHARDHSVSDGLEQIATWNAGALRSEDVMAAIQAKMAKEDAKFADLLDPA